MKRILSLLLAAAVLLPLGGCASIFDREVYTEEPYEAVSDTLDAEEDLAEAISNYTALRRAISRLVAEHTESAELQFQNYDGSISQDISTACWEVKSSTPLGAFAVDYISYDLSRIVSYYQAEIHITYKKSAYQVESLEQVETLSAMRTRLSDALRNGETYLVLEIAAASLTADTVSESVARAYYADPLLCPVLPAVTTGLYPESGVTRILEITLDYGVDSDTLTAQRPRLAEAAEAAAAESLANASDAEATAVPTKDYLAALRDYLAERCVVDETASGTALAALTEGTASSEGIAMAFEAGCQAMGIQCIPVFGRLDGETHVWNIITLDDMSCHVDASADGVFMASDADISGAYWWDTSEYPVCEEGDGASGEASAEMSSSEAEMLPIME